MDVLIARIARSRGSILVTNNINCFPSFERTSNRRIGEPDTSATIRRRFSLRRVVDLEGRIRMGFHHSLEIGLFRNFKWKFSLNENFDSRPPVHAPKNDLE